MKLVILTVLLIVPSVVRGGLKLYPLNESDSEAQELLSRGFFKLKEYEDLSLPRTQKTYAGFNETPSHFNLTNDGSGNYYFGYTSNDGTGRYEIGEIKNAGTDDEIQTIRGQYIEKYVMSDGKVMVRTIGYTADENGYRPFLIDISEQREEDGSEEVESR